jgi:hypothetical protein
MAVLPVSPFLLKKTTVAAPRLFDRVLAGL